MRWGSWGSTSSGSPPPTLCPRGTLSRRWCAAGCATDLPYLCQTASRRGNPRAFLPGARSVICVAMSYSRGRRSSFPGRPRSGCPLRPATRLPRRDPLPARTPRTPPRQPLPGSTVAACRGLGAAARTGARRPARAWASSARAPPSFIHGWVRSSLLGELVTSAALPAGTPLTAGCGACTACLDACPTGALTAPFRLDASRCISGWTIERRGPLPPEAMGRLHGSLFGCDLCQTACPFQRHAAPACNPVLATRPHLLGPVRHRPPPARRGRLAPPGRGHPAAPARPGPHAPKPGCPRPHPRRLKASGSRLKLPHPPGSNAQSLRLKAQGLRLELPIHPDRMLKAWGSGSAADLEP